MKSNSVERCASLLAATFSIALCASDARGAMLSMTFDSNQSAITLDGSFSGIDLSEQGPGSKTASYSGSITVDVDNLLAPTSIQILGSSAVAAITGQWLPEAGGGPAAGDPGMAQDANYGLQLNAGALGTAYAAVRNLEFDVTSGAETVVGGSFNSAQTLTIVSALFAFNLPPAFEGGDAGQDDLSGDMLTNASATPSTYSVAGLTATLTIPIEIVDQDDLTVMYTGQLVATARVPEPASVALAGMSLVGMLGFAGCARRK